jgi:branched-chain amino acid aminotransferase
MSTPILDTDAYVDRLLAAHRPGAHKICAFYDHRIGAISQDPRLLLMPVDDHLVHRGDGVFETMKFANGKIYQLDPHIRRLGRSTEAIFLAPPISLDAIRDITLDVARAANCEEGRLRILMGRGPGGFGISPMECPVPSLYVISYLVKPKGEELWEKGVTAFRTAYPAKQSWLAGIKSINYLPNVLMKREAVEKGYDFALCFDEHGFLAEGATENVIMVDENGTVVVPDLSNALAGTTLMRALELIGAERETDYRKISEDEVYQARELIIVGTTWDALAIVRYNDKPIHDARPGPVAKRIRELLQQDFAENGVAY